MSIEPENTEHSSTKTEVRSYFSQERRPLTPMETTPAANPLTALAYVFSGLLVGMVMLVVFTIITSTTTGGFPVGAAQLYPFAAFCMFGVWCSGKVLHRRPRWYSYVIVAIVAMATNANCQIGGLGFCISSAGF